MKSRNPVFTRGGGFGQQPGWAPSTGQLEDMYNAPAYSPPGQELGIRRMTIDDVVMRTAMTLGTVIVVAAVAWMAKLPVAVAMVGLVGGLVLGLVNSFKRVPSPALILAYAVFEGLFLGVISRMFEGAASGIVLQAVLGTVLAFGVMLALYTSRAFRVTARFRKIVIAAGIAVLGLMLVNLIASLFTPGGLGLREAGPLGILFSVVAIVVACLFLALDFNYAEEMVKAGAPERYSWQAAFGLTVTLVWLYIEMLRLLWMLRELAE